MNESPFVYNEQKNLDVCLDILNDRHTERPKLPLMYSEREIMSLRLSETCDFIGNDILKIIYYIMCRNGGAIETKVFLSENTKYTYCPAKKRRSFYDLLGIINVRLKELYDICITKEELAYHLISIVSENKYKKYDFSEKMFENDIERNELFRGLIMIHCPDINKIVFKSYSNSREAEISGYVVGKSKDTGKFFLYKEGGCIHDSEIMIEADNKFKTFDLIHSGMRYPCDGVTKFDLINWANSYKEKLDFFNSMTLENINEHLFDKILRKSYNLKYPLQNFIDMDFINIYESKGGNVEEFMKGRYRPDYTENVINKINKIKEDNKNFY